MIKTMEGGPNIQEVESGSNQESNDQNEITWAYSCCHPRGKMHRFVALLFMCFLGFGEFFFCLRLFCLVYRLCCDVLTFKTKVWNFIGK